MFAIRRKARVMRLRLRSYAEAARRRGSAHGVVRGRGDLCSPDPRVGAADHGQRDPAGKAARPEADAALVLALAGMAPRRGIRAGAPPSARVPAAAGSTPCSPLGVAAAALLPARTSEAHSRQREQEGA